MQPDGASAQQWVGPGTDSLQLQSVVPILFSLCYKSIGHRE